jgi:hypothetical protein
MNANAIASKLEAIERKCAMRSVDVASLLGTWPETVSRWKHGKSFPHPHTQKALLGLEYVVDLLGDFYEPQEARLWLFSPQKRLGSATPAALIQQGRIDEVVAILNQLRDGVYR